MKLIERNFYLDKLKNVVGTPDIKVITGIRRCGKSKLLQEFQQYIENEIKNCNIIHINFNLSKYNKLKESATLINYVENLYDAEKINFILI